MMWFKKKSETKLRPVMLLVQLPDGTRVLHSAVYRTVTSGGALALHDELGGGLAVAYYAPGWWSSVSVKQEEDK